MTDVRASELDRTIAGWLTAPSDVTPPDGLLDRAMRGVAATPQRPGWLARAAGAPAIVGGSADRPLTVRAAILVVGAALLTLLLLIGVAGGLTPPRPDRVVPAPRSTGGNDVRSASAAPQASASPSVPATPAPSLLTLVPDAMTYQDLGFRAQPFRDGRTTRDGSLVRFEGPPVRGPLDAPIPAAVVTVGVERALVGLDLHLGPTARRLAGRTLDELVDTIRSADGLTVEASTAAVLGGEAAERLVVADPSGDRETVLVAMHGDRIYLVEGRGNRLGSDPPDSADLVALVLFQAGFAYTDARLVTIGPVTVTMPDGWRRTSPFESSGRLAIGTGDAFGAAADVVSVDWAEPDESITIELGQQSGFVEIRGHDLATLLASAKLAFPGAAVTEVTIGGEPGWQIGVRQASYVRPLANLALTWHDGTAFVVEEHLILDGSPSGAFGTVLDGIAFR